MFWRSVSGSVRAQNRRREATSVAMEQTSGGAGFSRESWSRRWAGGKGQAYQVIRGINRYQGGEPIWQLSHMALKGLPHNPSDLFANLCWFYHCTPSKVIFATKAINSTRAKTGSSSHLTATSLRSQPINDYFNRFHEHVFSLQSLRECISRSEWYTGHSPSNLYI